MLSLAGALGCSTDCDDAIGKLEACALPLPNELGAACDDESTLACQARCIRDASCRQLDDSIEGEPTSFFDRCVASCGGGNVLASLRAGGDGGGMGAGGAAAND